MTKDDNGKIRVLVFELEGSNETLQESLRTVMANALGQSLSPIRPVADQPTLPNTESRNSASEADNRQTIEIEAEEQGFKRQAETTSSSNSRPKRKQRFPTPKILDLDLTAGSVPFKAFYELKKNPSMDTKRYLLIAAWFKEYCNQGVISPDHVYTCYRFMGWSIPKDPSKPFRNMKSDGYFNHAEKNLWEINHVGLNIVNQLGAS